jgi:hypothetical protein
VRCSIGREPKEFLLPDLLRPAIEAVVGREDPSNVADGTGANGVAMGGGLYFADASGGEGDERLLWIAKRCSNSPFELSRICTEVTP